ncbi:MAG: hypothetical protein CL908_13995 [Deltaproteobacteria bacterium]|nr:hypothetical protein [Deltaproteobacteria bacterium]
MTHSDFQPEKILAALQEAGVEYVLIGGFAAIAHGDVAPTFDVDVVPHRSLENMERVAIALRNLDARIRTEGVPEGLRFDFTAKSLGRSTMWNLVTTVGAIDLTFEPSGTRGYTDLRRSAFEIDVDGIVITVASLADVIRSKEAAGREKDRIALPRLRRLLERLQDAD